MRIPRYLVASALAFVAFLVVPEIASATAIHVSSFTDPGAGCTLRNAITAANTTSAAGACPAGQAAPTVDTIDFTGTGVISLGSSLPAITGPVTITGPGVAQLTVSGVTSYQPFKINSGAVVTLSGMTIANGLCGSTCGSQGGAINSNGTLTLDDVVLTGNVASDTTAAANSFAEGGAIENNSGGTLTVIDSEIRTSTVTASNGTSQNAASGGAIMNRGTATIIRSEISSNVANASATSPATSNVNGGAIESDGHLTIQASLINNNQVTSGGSGSSSLSGGGIAQFNDPATSLTIDNSTIAANSTQVGGTGGGIYSIGNVGTITNSTIYGNSSPTGANLYMSTQLRLSNTIVSNPTAGPNCSGAAVISEGFNLESASSCGLNQSTDKSNTPSNLGALTDNGGPTRTRAPLAGSAVIDAGKAAAGVTTDQRGLIRPSDIATVADVVGGDGSDIGAVEVQDTVAPDTTITSGPAEGSTVGPKPEFGFSSSEGRSHFECAVDGAAFAACSTPDALSALGDGAHTFQVRAIDGTGNADATPASRSFTVDATAPTTKLGKVKKKTSKRKLKVKFSSEAGATFECRVDSKPFKACTSPYKTKKLKPGKHTIEVRAGDAYGNVEAKPAKAKFKVLRQG
ncbi:MAG: choice-of-anchor Q domain-containing protein [Solirubrobacterales bacterium]